MTRITARLVLLVASILALASGSLAGAQDDALRRLAERLVGAWGAPGEMRVALEVGALPADLRVALPVPEGFELLGSLVRTERGELLSVQAVFDGPERTDDAFEALRTTFEGAGWTFIVEGGTFGFVPFPPNFFARACAPLGADDPNPRSIAFVHVAWLPGGASDVRIDVSHDTWEGACTPGSEADWGSFAPLPALAAPEGATLSVPVANHDGDDAIAAAFLRGLSDVTAVHAHYQEQLTALGWLLTGSQELGDDEGVSLARSAWTRTDDAGRSWHALLGVERVRGGEAIALQYTVSGNGDSPLPDAP
jgi:hypothetical protein